MQSSDATRRRSLQVSVKTTCPPRARAGPATPRVYGAVRQCVLVPKTNAGACAQRKREGPERVATQGHGLPYARFGA